MVNNLAVINLATKRVRGENNLRPSAFTERERDGCCSTASRPLFEPILKEGRKYLASQPASHMEIEYFGAPKNAPVNSSRKRRRRAVNVKHVLGAL